MLYVEQYKCIISNITNVQINKTKIWSKFLLSRSSSTPLTRHATDYHPWAPPIHFSVTYGAN